MSVHLLCCPIRAIRAHTHRSKQQKHKIMMVKSYNNILNHNVVCIIQCFLRHTFEFSQSWFRCFIVSTFHNRTFDFSLSCYQVLPLVFSTSKYPKKIWKAFWFLFLFLHLVSPFFTLNIKYFILLQQDHITATLVGTTSLVLVMLCHYINKGR